MDNESKTDETEDLFRVVDCQSPLTLADTRFDQVGCATYLE